jgi:poly(3-hydroxybutyrate) depolymerase
MGPRARVVPVIVVQGGADRIVRAGNGDRVARQWLTTSRLASPDAGKLDFALPHATTTDRAPGGLSYSVRSWNDDSGRPVLQYWNVPDLGHAWSGGAREGSYTDPRGPSATEAMWSFFQQCSMSGDQAVNQPAVVAAPGRRVAGSVRKPGRRWLPVRPNAADVRAG